MRLSLTFNQKNTLDYNLVVTGYPEITGGESQYDTTAVAGRMGELVGREKYKSNITIKVPLALLGKFTHQRFFIVRKWFSGSGILKISDSPETFYRVLKANIEGATRPSQKHGELTATFLCDPYEYREDGNIEYAPEDITVNPYSPCCPVYKITGEGTCELIVNGKSMSANVGQNLTIDTGRMIAFREDGEMQNTSVTGNYEDLRLPQGTVDITITKGFTLKIIPQWGYEL